MTHAVQEVEKLAQKQIDQNAVPGLAIAVVFQDKVVYAKGFGVRDVNTKAPVDADTVFQLASVSKPIGSTVVAELVERRKNNLGLKTQRARSHIRDVRSLGHARKSPFATCTRIGAACPITLAICSRI